MGTIKPLKLLFISFIVWIFFYTQTPVEYLYNGSALFPIFTIVSYILLFALGIYSLKSTFIKIKPTISLRKVKQLIYVLFLIGFIGVLLKIYIGFFKTEIFVANDIFEKRLENMHKELTGGIIGVFASILFPFSFISLLLSIYYFKIINKFMLIFIIIFGFYPLIESYFMGGRTIIVLLGLTLIFVFYQSYFKNFNFTLVNIKISNFSLLKIPSFLFKKKIYIPLFLISILFIVYSIQIVNKRLDRFGYGDATFRVWEKKDYQWVKFDEDYKKEYFSSNKQEKSKMIGLYSLKHYFAHGVIEYIRLVNHLDKTTGYYYGQYEFNVFFKFFKAFGVPLKSANDLAKILSRKAVYSTFWGPFYIDFGIVGFIIIFFWGRFVKRVFIHAKRGRPEFVIFYGYISTIIITSFFINFLLGSSSYYLFSFFITILLFKYWPNKLIMKTNG